MERVFLSENKEDIMITWNNLDTLDSYKELSKASRVNLAEVMSGENGAERVKITAFLWLRDLLTIMQQKLLMMMCLMHS